MAIHEGARRVVKALSVFAWLILSISVVVACAILFGREPWLSVGAVFSGAVVFAIFQGAAWIVAGFSGNPRESDGLVRWADLWRWRRKPRRTNPVVHDAGPAGVGGWLLLLVIGLLVLGPLAGIGKTMQAIEVTERTYPNIIGIPAWVHYKSTGWSLIAMACLVSVAAGWGLLKSRQSGAVQFAIAALWIRGPAVVILDAISATIFLQTGFAEYFSDPSLVGDLLGNFAAATIWTAYLKMSRRVRNTYHQRLHTSSAPALVEQERAEKARVEPRL